jgi:hypothetical protein
VRVRVCVFACACVRLRVCAFACVCVCVRVCVCVWLFEPVHGSMRPQFEANNGINQWLVFDNCRLTLTHRPSLQGVFGTASLIPKLYAVAWSASLPDTFSLVARALEDIVREDMSTGFFACIIPPCDETLQHTRSIAVLTIKRVMITRGEHDEGDQVREDLQLLFDDYLNIFNGCTREPRIQHFCFKEGCCTSAAGILHNRDAATQRVLRCLLRLVFAPLGYVRHANLGCNLHGANHMQSAGRDS